MLILTGGLTIYPLVTHESELIWMLFKGCFKKGQEQKFNVVYGIRSA